MEALAERLYRRYRARYLTVAELVGMVLLTTVFVLPSCVLFGVLVDAEGAEQAGLVAIGLVVYPAAVLVAQRWSRRSLRPLVAWLDGDRSDPAAAWTSAQQASMIYTRVGEVVGGIPVYLAMGLWLLAVQPSGRAVVGLLLATPWVAAAIGLVTVVGFDLFFLPVQQEVSEHLAPSDRVPGRGIGLASKVMGAVLLAAWTTAVGTVALTIGVADREDRLLAASLVVLLGLTYTGAVVWSLLTRPMLRPIRELRAATERIAVGDLSREVPPATTDELGELVASFNAMQHGLQERAALHAAFGTYVDPELAERVLTQGDAAFAGEDVEVTVCFVDVRSFTAYAESVAPTEAFALLNRLFGVVVPVIRAHGGHPNRYLGDGLLAVFGAPGALVDHADRAIAAAVEVAAAVESTLGGAIRIGIGLNTGPVIAGTIGGGGKLEYTVIGDVVNVAARVEQLTKKTGDTVLLTEATRLALRVPPLLVDRGAHAVPGKAEQVHVHAVA